MHVHNNVEAGGVFQTRPRVQEPPIILSRFRTCPTNLVMWKKLILFRGTVYCAFVKISYIFGFLMARISMPYV